MERHEMNKFKQKFDSLKNDVDRWKFVLENKDKDFQVLLDNDMTFIDFNDDEFDLTCDFDGYLGWSDGVFSLLKALGIPHDGV